MPEGETVVFSAHGVAPSVHANAAVRALNTIDATCPLVTKVHREAVKFASDGYTIVLVGHAGHEEVEGTDGVRRRSTSCWCRPRRTWSGSRSRRPRQGRVHHPDHSLRGRDDGDHPPAAREVPEHGWPPDRRHLLRDAEPPGCGQAARAALRPRARDRVAQLFELEPPGRGRAPARRPLAPDRQRAGGPRGVARRRGNPRGHHIRGERPGGVGPAAGRVLSRPRSRQRSPSSRSRRRTCASCFPRTSASCSPRGRNVSAAGATVGSCEGGFSARCC